MDVFVLKWSCYLFGAVIQKLTNSLRSQDLSSNYHKLSIQYTHNTCNVNDDDDVDNYEHYNLLDYHRTLIFLNIPSVIA